MKKIVKINLLSHNSRSLLFLSALVCVLQLSFVNTYAQPATGTTVRVFAPPPKPTKPIEIDSLSELEDLPLPEVAEEPVTETAPEPEATTEIVEDTETTIDDAATPTAAEASGVNGGLIAIIVAALAVVLGIVGYAVSSKGAFKKFK